MRTPTIGAKELGEECAQLRAELDAALAELADARKDIECDEQRVAELMAQVDEVGRELDAALAELADARKDIEYDEQRVAELMAQVDEVGRERDAALADARRYRWLHNFDHWSWSMPPMRAISFSWLIKCDKSVLDAAIDAALREEE